MATIKIEGIGNVEIPDKQMWASEETLADLVKALDGRGPSKLARAQKDLTDKNTKAGREVQMFGKTLFKMNPALTAIETGFNMLGRAITGATGLVKSLAQADGSFSSLGGVVDYAAEQISNTFGRLPLIGGFFDATAQATAELTKLRLAMMDLQKEAFQSLANIGLKLNNDLGDTLSTVLRANISIDHFNRLITQNNDGLRVFGGSVNDAVVRFSTNIERLTRPDSEMGMGLRMLGLGSNEIAQEFIEFVQSQRSNNKLLAMTDQELNKQMLTRIKNERIIAELTGKTVQEQRSAQMALAADAAYQAALLSFPPEVRDNIDNLVSGLDDNTARLVKQLLGYGTALDDETAMLTSAIPGLRGSLLKGINDIVNGTAESSDVLADVLNTVNNTDISGFAKLGMIDPRFANVFGDLFLLSQRSKGQLEMMDNMNAAMGTTYSDITEVQDAFNKQYQEQIELAKSLTGTDKEEVEKRLREMTVNGKELDDKTIEIIMQSAQVEEAVGNIQSEIFDLSTNFSGLSDVVGQVTETFNKLLDKAGLTPKSEGPSSYSRMSMYKKAGGGSVGSGLYLVGERGPELLKLSQGAMGRVYPHGVTKNMLAGKAAGGMNIFGGSGGGDMLSSMFGEEAAGLFTAYAGGGDPLGIKSAAEGSKGGLQSMMGATSGDLASIMNNGSMGTMMMDSIGALFSANPDEAMAAATGKFEKANAGALNNMVSQGQSMAQQMEGNPAINNLVKQFEGFSGETQGKLQEKSNITQEMVLSETKQTNKILKDFLATMKTTNGYF